MPLTARARMSTISIAEVMNSALIPAVIPTKQTMAVNARMISAKAHQGKDTP